MTEYQLNRLAIRVFDRIASLEAEDAQYVDIAGATDHDPIIGIDALTGEPIYESDAQEVP